MCGIYGYSLPDHAYTDAQRAIIATALTTAMDERGGDSWGLYAANAANAANDDGVSHVLQRGLGDAGGGLSIPSIMTYTTLAAHTRKATTGLISARNAHPFRRGRVIGAHNGIVWNHREINLKYARNCAVDSEHIIQHLSEHRPLADIQGYGAVWYVRMDDDDDDGQQQQEKKTKKPKKPKKPTNSSNTTVHLFRSSSGNLAVYGLGPHEAPTGVVWASTSDAVEQALALAGLRGWPYKVESEQVYHIGPTGGLRYTPGLRHRFGDYSPAPPLPRPLNVGDADEAWRQAFFSSTTTTTKKPQQQQQQQQEQERYCVGCSTYFRSTSLVDLCGACRLT